MTQLLEHEQSSWKDLAMLGRVVGCNSRSQKTALQILAIRRVKPDLLGTGPVPIIRQGHPNSFDGGLDLHPGRLRQGVR